jgi:hypothetical protein
VELELGAALEHEKSARAQKLVGVPRNPTSPLLPETYHRDRSFRRKLELVRAFAREKMVEPTIDPRGAADLAKRLDAVHARGALRDVSDAVCLDIAIERDPEV